MTHEVDLTDRDLAPIQVRTIRSKLDRFLDTSKDVREVCKEVAFVPFPELELLTR